MPSSVPNQSETPRQAVDDAFGSINLQSPDYAASAISVSTGSSGTDDHVPGDHYDDEWADLMSWNWDNVVADMRNSLDWRKSARDVQKDPNAATPLRPPPQKVNFQGDFHYVEYVPAWTSPNFNPDKEFFGLEGQDEESFERFKAVFWARLRPAQAMLDSFYNPTDMAKRYGMHPNRRDGRSRLSPLDCLSRKVRLEKSITTPDGTRRSFVDMKYYKRVHNEEYMGPENAANVEAGQSFDAFLIERSTSSDHPQQQDLTEVYEKLLALGKQMADDQEYQRAFFNEFTTDELINQKVLCFRDDVEYELHGTLHPYLQRQKWDTTENRGDDIDTPKLLWSFDGNRGEWSAHDDTVWAVLQPALQLASRFLNLDPPILASLMDYRSQQPLWQDKFTKRGHYDGSRLRSVWFTQFDVSKTWPCLERLHNIGFDSASWVQTILEERLELFIGSAYRDETGRCGGRHYAWTNTFGVVDVGNTRILGNDWRIRIEIAAELIWPLLAPQYSKAEKLTCSFAIAATIFHEITHAVVIALEHMRDFPSTFSTKENEIDVRIPPEAMAGLTVARMEMPGSGNEPFFEHHTEAEVGFAVETELFGGAVDPIFHTSQGNTPDNFGLLTTAVTLRGFPRARPVEPRGHKLGIDIIPDVAAPVVNLRTPIPFDMTSRLFTRKFWETDYKRFGLETLKLYPEGRITKGAVPEMKMYMIGDLAIIFGKKKAKWMVRALRELNSKGFETIANYLDEVCRQYVSCKVTRRNWYFDSRRWPMEEPKIEKCLDGVRQAGSSFVVAFAALTADEANHHQAVRDLISRSQQPGALPLDFDDTLSLYREQLSRTADRAFSSFLSWLKALERLMSLRLRHAQFLVRSYLQLEASDRSTISNGRGIMLRKHMDKTVINPYNRVRACFAATVNFIQSRVDPAAAKEPVEELSGAYDNLTGIFHMTQETVEYLKPEYQDDHIAGAGARLDFLPSSAFDPAVRAERLRPLAMADLEFVKSTDVKTIVQVFESIFRSQDGKEILPKDQATLDEKLADLTDLLETNDFAGASLQPAGDDGQPKPPSNSRAGPGRGQRGPMNMFNLGPKRDSSRVTKPKKTTTKKLEETVGRVLTQDPTTKSSKYTHLLKPSTLKSAATRTASAQASMQFVQYASANTTTMGFPRATPGQPPAFAAPAAPAPPANPSTNSSSSSSLGQAQQRFRLFPHPFADQTTLDEDLTQEERNWGAQIAQAQLPADLTAYRGQVADILEFDDRSAASTLLALAALGPPSQDGGPGNRQRALAVHATVGQAVGAALPSTGPVTDLHTAAASMQPVQLLTATWAAEWTASGGGGGVADAGVTVEEEVAAYATRRMSQSQPQSAGQGDGDAPADPQAGGVPSVNEILSLVMGSDDAMQIDGEGNEEEIS